MDFKRIILIDDNETNVFVNTDLIEEALPDMPIITITNPQEFLDKALSSSEWFENETLVFLDLNMPDKFGYEVLEELEEEIEELDNFHVIILTSSNLMRDLERSTRFPNIIGYIEKPLTPKNLEASLSGTSS